jgi:hypothetical protein
MGTFDTVLGIALIFLSGFGIGRKIPPTPIESKDDKRRKAFAHLAGRLVSLGYTCDADLNFRVSDGCRTIYSMPLPLVDPEMLNAELYEIPPAKKGRSE